MLTFLRKKPAKAKFISHLVTNLFTVNFKNFVAYSVCENYKGATIQSRKTLPWKDLKNRCRLFSSPFVTTYVRRHYDATYLLGFKLVLSEVLIMPELQ